MCYLGRKQWALPEQKSDLHVQTMYTLLTYQTLTDLFWVLLAKISICFRGVTSFDLIEFHSCLITCWTRPVGANHSCRVPRLPGARLERALSFERGLPNQVPGVVLGEEGLGSTQIGPAGTPEGWFPLGQFLSGAGCVTVLASNGAT